MRKYKKIVMTVSSVLLIATVSVGMTLAFLTDKTDPRKNIFSMGPGIDGEIQEPVWDESGKDEATNFTPGRVIHKDPQVVNKSSVKEGQSADAWVAVKISYDGFDDYSQMTDLLTIDWNDSTKDSGDNGDQDGDYWIFEADGKYLVAYYSAAVPAGTATETIFDTVTITQKAIAREQYDSLLKPNKSGAIVPDLILADYNLPGNFASLSLQERTELAEQNVSQYIMKDFNITFVGYLVQKEGFEDARTAMQEAFSDEF